MKKITQIGLARIANKAAREFRPSGGNSAQVQILSDGSIHVATTAAGGDNVPWATKLHGAVMWAIASYYFGGYDNVELRDHRHGCGYVSQIIAPKSNVPPSTS